MSYKVAFDPWTFLIPGSCTSRVNKSLQTSTTTYCLMQCQTSPEGGGSVGCLHSTYFETEVWELVL